MLKQWVHDIHQVFLPKPFCLSDVSLSLFCVATKSYIRLTCFLTPEGQIPVVLKGNVLLML